MFTPAFQFGGILPDLVLVSADAVSFHVHHHRLLAVSTNRFGGLIGHLSSPVRRIHVPEPSVALNIVLHIIYRITCVHFQPPIESTDAALVSLSKYGVSPAQLAASLVLSQLMLSYAPHRAIDAYAVAGHHRLEKIAVALSAHLLAYDVTTLSEELSVKMGADYYRRLADLQQARVAALQAIVRRPPAKHPLVPGCNEEIQRERDRTWERASTDIVWNALPNMSSEALQAAFMQAATSVECTECRTMFRNRTREVTTQWSAVKACGHSGPAHPAQHFR